MFLCLCPLNFYTAQADQHEPSGKTAADERSSCPLNIYILDHADIL